MLLGINNKPYLDITEFVDIDGLRHLHKDICFGLAKSKFSTTIYGPGLGDLAERKSFLDLAKQYSNSSDDFDKEIYSSLDWNQRAIFFKLYEEMYNASAVVTLRDMPPDKRIENYFKKGLKEFTVPTENAKHFPKVIDWISKLDIFEQVGRIVFFMNEHDCTLQMHMDAPKYFPHNEEFIWMNPTGKKKFWLLDPETSKKIYVDAPVAFFNSLDWHGGDAISTFTYSLRIDGKFTNTFKEKIGIAHLKHY